LKNETRSVVIIESSNYEKARVGETLPPGIQSVLERLGVWDAFLEDEHDAAYGVASSWGSGELSDNDFIYRPEGHGWHLDRKRFDSMLAREAGRQGALLLTGSRLVGHKKSGGGRWKLRVRSGGRKTLDVSAKFVVDATGRRAAFACQQGAKRLVCDRLVGVFGLFTSDQDQRGTDTFTLIEACEEGWWYSAFLPNSRAVVAYMSDADIVGRGRMCSNEQWLKRLCGAGNTSGRVAHCRLDSRLAVYPANSYRLDRVAGDGWLAAGDAASGYDPLSSAGIYKALTSGLAAARAISGHLKGEQGALEKYESSTIRSFDTYLRTRAAYYRVERRWPDSLFWKRRQLCLTLDPRQALSYDETNVKSPLLIERDAHQLLLPAADLTLLCRLCESPAKAHEVVRAFKARSKRAIPDEKVIMALQGLLDRGIVKARESRVD
jgi:flavin-dependent dehydrogenase